MTSVLQTTAGKMIFGRLWEEKDEVGGEVSNPNIHDSRAAGFRKQYRDMRHTSAMPIRMEEEIE